MRRAGPPQDVESWWVSRGEPWILLGRISSRAGQLAASLGPGVLFMGFLPQILAACVVASHRALWLDLLGTQRKS